MRISSSLLWVAFVVALCAVATILSFGQSASMLPAYQASPTPTPSQWLNQPPTAPNAMRQCPDSGLWALLYWGGTDNAPIATAADACPSVDNVWVSREGKWLGFAKVAPQASDSWQVLYGEAHFMHGK
jgi:hypothetical protein